MAANDLVQGPFGARYLVQKAGKKRIAVIDRRGGLYTDSGDLTRLIGRPTTPLAATITTALAAPAAA